MKQRTVVQRSVSHHRPRITTSEPAESGIASGFMSLLGKLTAASERLDRARARTRPR